MHEMYVFNCVLFSLLWCPAVYGTTFKIYTQPTDLYTIAAPEIRNDQWLRNYSNFFNVTVNSDTDTVSVDSSLCEETEAEVVGISSLDGQCTLRNAIAYCATKLVNITTHCAVHLPPMAELTVKSSEISIANLVGNMTIYGHGALIKSYPSINDYGFIRVDGDGVRDNFHFNMHNMSIDGFGSTTDAGGGVWAGNLGSGFFEHLIFQNCKGRDGGGLDIQASTLVTVFHCEFRYNYCVGNGGGLAIGELNTGIIVRDCIFVRNSALELGHVGGGFGGKLRNSCVLLCFVVFCYGN